MTTRGRGGGKRAKAAEAIPADNPFNEEIFHVTTVDHQKTREGAFHAATTITELKAAFRCLSPHETPRHHPRVVDVEGEEHRQAEEHVVAR
eukprot:1762851-Heterocapsa_arctica.AAC.1